MQKTELESFKSRLVEMRARLIGEVQDMQNGIRETLNPPGENSGYHTHLSDAGGSGASGLDREILLSENEAGILRQVEDALQRIEQGRFGICENCQRPIGDERLDAIPYTPYCIDCADLIDAETTAEMSRRPFRSDRQGFGK